MAVSVVARLKERPPQSNVRGFFGTSSSRRINEAQTGASSLAHGRGKRSIVFLESQILALVQPTRGLGKEIYKGGRQLARDQRSIDAFAR